MDYVEGTGSKPPEGVITYPQREVILTHTGKLGDALYALMVGSWLHKEYNRKIHWVLPRCFGPFRYIENLLMLQEQTSRVTLVDHAIKDFSCGGQPYKFDPATFGIDGEYFNLGFRGYPNKFIAAFYAEEYGLWIDPDFTLNLGEWEYFDQPELLNFQDPHDLTWRSSELAMQMLLPDVQPLPTSIDLLRLAMIMHAAKEFHSWYCGIAVLCWLANIPAHVYRVKEHAPLEFYFPHPRSLQIHELDIHPKDMIRR